MSQYGIAWPKGRELRHHEPNRNAGRSSGLEPPEAGWSSWVEGALRVEIGWQANEVLVEWPSHPDHYERVTSLPLGLSAYRARRASRRRQRTVPASICRSSTGRLAVLVAGPSQPDHHEGVTSP
mgnify:CR=1 FL=1